MKKLIYLISFLFINAVMAQDDCIPIPNGNFQEWTGNDDPVNWLTTNMGDKYGTQNVSFDMRNVFQTPGKFGYGVRIKNASVLEMLKKEKPEEYAKLPPSVIEQLRKNSFSGSLFTCQGDCESATMSQNEIFMREKMSFPVAKAPGALCGYYKANLKEGDKLWIWPILFMNSATMAGGVMPGETASVISKSTGDWTPFRIPLRILPNRKVTKALIQMQMVNSGFPVTPPYGMSAIELAKKYPSTDGSEVFIDELCFCGEADYIKEGDPVLNGIDLGNGSGETNSDDDSTNNDDDDNSENIYIATNGSDTNSGNKTNPFATMQKALNVAQGRRMQGKTVKITVKNGTYRQEATLSGTGNGSLPPLIIEAENIHQAIFIGSEPITENANWQSQIQNLYMSSTANLHKDQKPVSSNFSNPMETIVPALVVNGVQLKHQQGGDLRNTPNAYMYTPQQFLVNPGNVNLSSATVEVSVRENAINVMNGGNVIVKGVRLKGFPQASVAQLSEQQMPGLDGVQAVNCQYE